MSQRANELLLEFSLLRAKIRTVMGHFENALYEDRTENADMFDLTRHTFPTNPHPNRTLRALERDLEKESPAFLLLLAALLEAGKELALGLADYTDALSLADGVAVIREELRAADLSPAALAHAITEIKAEHSAKRLSLSARMLDPSF